MKKVLAWINEEVCVTCPACNTTLEVDADKEEIETVHPVISCHVCGEDLHIIGLLEDDVIDLDSIGNK